jgi:hypothetical protein
MHALSVPALVSAAACPMHVHLRIFCMCVCLSSVAASQVDAKGGEQQVMDFNAWTDAWNADVEAAEQAARAGTLEVQAGALPILRKRAFDLQEYWRVSQADDNARRTAEKHWPVLRPLRVALRAAHALPQQDTAATSADAPATAVPFGVAHVLAAGGPVSFAPMMPQPQAAGPHAAATAAALAGPAAAAPAAKRVPAFVPPMSQAPALYSGPQFGQQPASTQLCNPQPPLAQQAKRARAPSVCQTCGHLRLLGYYGKLHGSRSGGGGQIAGSGCAVPDEERHAAADRVTQGHRRGIFPECTCAHCAAALREAGAAKKQRVSGAVEHSAESEGGSAERGDSAVAESAGVAAVIGGAGGSAQHRSASAADSAVAESAGVAAVIGGAGGSAQHRSASAAAAAVIAAPRSGSSGGGDANTESGGVARNSA